MVIGKKLWVILTAMAVAFQATGITSYAEEKEKPSMPENETDRVIVTMEKGEKSEVLTGETMKTLDTGGTAELVSVEVPDGMELEAFMEQLEQESGVAGVEPDYLINTTGKPNDPYYSYQYQHEVLNMERAWSKTKGASDVTVAVLDNGFDLDHPELRYQWDTAYWTASQMSEDDHGTHVAGIIGASIDNYTHGSGVAPHANLMPIDVFEGELAYTSDVITGIYLATQEGADVINMSLGSYYYNSSYNSAIQYAHQNGVVIVASAGNDDSSLSHYPSGYDNVISVGATDKDDWITDFSNYGYDQDIVAPGENIWSTLKWGRFGSASGTSMASPVVAGVVALVKANEPNLTNIEIEERLFETAVDLGIPGKDVLYGHGRVDAAAALKIMDIQQPTVSAVNDDSTELVGNLNQVVEDATIILSNDGGEIARQENYGGMAEFRLAMPKQQAGRSLYLSITDRYGNTSEVLEIRVVDNISPTVPVVEEVTDQSIKVTGTAEAGSRISVKAGAAEIGTAKANADGTFSVSIPKQKAGTALSVTAIDGSGNISQAATVKVRDVTAPQAPVVDQVAHTATKISGTAEAGSDIVVKAGTKEIVKGKTAADSTFSLSIEPQAVGTVLTVSATDSAGNKSAETTITVVKAGAEVTDRISGTDRYSTAIAISKSGWKTADTVVLATAGDFPDALAGGPLAYQENAPILLTRTKALNAETKQEIQRLGAQKVIILGSTGAVSAEAEAELARMGLSTERLGGKNRFETAALIAGKMNSAQAVVANGLNFPDVLSVSSYAAKNGVPILLTRTDRLPDETKAALKGVSSTYVIGSTGVVSESVSDSLPTPTRFGGKDRYETGYEVATKLKLGTDKAYIATGSNFPDALAGSVLAAKNNAPILLTRPQQIPEATNKQLASYDGFSIFGGTGAVSDVVKASLDKALKN